MNFKKIYIYYCYRPIATGDLQFWRVNLLYNVFLTRNDDDTNETVYRHLWNVCLSLRSPNPPRLESVCRTNCRSVCWSVRLFGKLR